MELLGSQAKFMESVERLDTPKGQEFLEASLLSGVFSRIEGQPYSDDLKRQFEVATPVSRKMTGVSFYLSFHVPDDAPPMRTYPQGAGSTDLGSDRFKDRDAIGMFMLWFEEGRLSALEGAAIDQWPSDVSSFEILSS
jgi:hypothetical protein